MIWVDIFPIIMRYAGFFLLFLLFLVVSLDGIGLADGADAYVLYLQGDEGRITDKTEGIFTIMVTGLPTLMNVTKGDQNSTVPVYLISNISAPSHAAITFSHSGNPSVAIINISQISLNDNNSNLTLTGTSLPFYDDTALVSVTGDIVDLNQVTADQWSDIGVYLEIQNIPPTNMEGGMNKKCDLCRGNCVMSPQSGSCLEICCFTYCYGYCE